MPQEDERVNKQLRRTSTQVAIADVSAAAGNPPTKTEYDALVVKFNLVLGVLRDAELIPSA